MKKGFSANRFSYRSYIRVVGLFVLWLSILFLDFFAKAYIYHIFPFYDSYREFAVFRDFLGIDFFIALTVNPGAAWGIFSDFQIILLVIRILVIVGMLIYLFFMNQNRTIEAPLVLIIAGAIGNVIDFFLYGFVVDFLHFNLWGYHFPVFNFADTSITMGVIWLFLSRCLFRSHASIKMD